MSTNTIKNDRKYTYEDYLTWNDGKRWEIIDGVAYMMSPAPNREHQEILSSLFAKFYAYLQGKKCKVYPAPFDVRLSKPTESSKKASSTVQPDITVVCDQNKLDSRGLKGSPDLVIEILSPSSGKLDKIEKRKLYELHGVKEYWIVDPSHQMVDRFSYDNDLSKYKQVESFARDATITPIIFPDLQIRLEEVFPEIIEESELDE